MTLPKAKDGRSGVTLGSYRLRLLELGADDDGDPITSCTIEWLNESTPRKKASARRSLTAAAQKALNELHKLIIAGRGQKANGHERAPDGAVLVTLADWRIACRTKGLSTTREKEAERKAFERSMDALEKENCIATYEDSAWSL